MNKLNNSGFALMETLIVSVFVMGIFSLLYTNAYPILAEYESTENYNNIEYIYKTDTLKRFLVSAGYNKNKNITTIEKFSCDNVNLIEECNVLLKKLNVDNVYLAPYNKFNKLPVDDSGIEDYIKYLPSYKNSDKFNNRIIVKYKKIVNMGTDNEKTIYKYATLGVDL